MPSSFIIRPARPDDLPAILAIFNDLIATSTAVYTETPVDLAERMAWFRARQEGGFPVLVAEETETLDGRADAAAQAAAAQGAGAPSLPAAQQGANAASRVLGYATFGPFRGSWPGYRHTVEHSVHVRQDQRGRGLGTALIQALFPLAQAQGVHVMVGAIDASNTGSLRLHARLGFVQTGLMPQVGRKFGRWLDLALVQRTFPERAEDDATDPGQA